MNERMPEARDKLTLRTVKPMAVNFSPCSLTFFCVSTMITSSSSNDMVKANCVGEVVFGWFLGVFGGFEGCGGSCGCW